MIIKTAQNEREMIALAFDIAGDLQGGETLALVGDLGAGKTHFCKGLVAGLESDELVTSPTFSLVNEYRNGRLPVFHFDFYRMESINELESIGWEEYLDEDGILLVEWADKFPESLPGETVWYRFAINKDQSRTIAIE